MRVYRVSNVPLYKQQVPFLIYQRSIIQGAELRKLCGNCLCSLLLCRIRYCKLNVPHWTFFNHWWHMLLLGDASFSREGSIIVFHNLVFSCGLHCDSYNVHKQTLMVWRAFGNVQLTYRVYIIYIAMWAVRECVYIACSVKTHEHTCSTGALMLTSTWRHSSGGALSR